MFSKMTTPEALSDFNGTKSSNTISAAPTTRHNSSLSQNIPRNCWNISYDGSDAPVTDDNSSDKLKPTGIIPKSGGPPEDSSDSDEGSRPSTPSPPFSKKPLSIPTISKINSGTYHFDMKMKPEIIPTWNENEDTLARWMEKVEQLANISPNVFKELGRIVPRRFTGLAETWYYSISRECRNLIESDWGTLKAAIADY